MGQRIPAGPGALLVAAVLLVTVLAIPASVATADRQHVTPPPTQQIAGQAGPTCDYAGLFDETIGSVVLVSRSGGEGSGFVYETFEGNATSYVLTNEHVVAEAGNVTVRFREGEYGTGTVVGRDAYADLAVVRVDGTPGYADALPIAADVPRPGRGVAALGSPFGLRSTITHGIVSGVNRSMPTDRGYAVPDVVQTDAPINPGNSGGPLLTCDGAVVGVNTAGIQAAFGENVGFAISSSLIRRVAPALIAEGEVDWPYLGIRSTDVTPAVADSNGLDVANGVAVVETVEGGPSAGVLQPSGAVRTVDGEAVPTGGDVIVAIEGRPVDNGEDLSSYLATEAAPDETVNITVVRDGEQEGVEVTLGERPGPQTAAGG